MEQTKYFTPKEATQTLPLIKKIVEDILKTGQDIRDLSQKIGQAAENDPQVNQLADQLEELFGELEELGCFYKDWNFSMGLVDFPALLDGKEVYLCWRSDEQELLYYHDAEQGFAGRKAIPSHLLQ